MEEMKSFMLNYSKRIVGPAMLEYTKWILFEAQRKNIKRLYFLARDGYLLSKIAKRIIEKNGLDIDCRYLYCSRASLRLPSYHAISEEETFDILLLGGYYVTPKSLLQRACFSDDELQRLYDELEISFPDNCLNEDELNALRQKIKKNDFYKQAVIEKSKLAFPATIDYLKSEGLFDSDHVAIVDSGWTGSMQRSLRQLLEAAGHTPKITGFYFGMYVSPKDEKDGEYNTYYFSKNKGTKRKIYFNNNLFECMLSAPHPMTLGYEYDENGHVRPYFANNHSEKMLPLIEAQIEGALEYTEGYLEGVEKEYNEKASLKRTYKILKRAMVYPTKEEADIFSSFTFCDDITEKYQISLADENMRKSLKEYLILNRVFKKLLGKKQSGKSQLFWPYGVIAHCPKIVRPWYRLNVLFGDYLKFMLKK